MNTASSDAVSDGFFIESFVLIGRLCGVWEVRVMIACEYIPAGHDLAPDLWVFTGSPSTEIVVSFYVAAFSGERAWGPGFGGCRDWATVANPTVSPAEDAVNLASGMRRKAVLMGYAPRLDGGKSVVLVLRNGDPIPLSKLIEVRRNAVLTWMGECLNQLNLATPMYILAEDMGIGPEYMEVMARATPWVAGLPTLAGDPSPWTARGCTAALIAVADRMPSLYTEFTSFSLENATFGVVGLGSTGFGSEEAPGMVRLLAEQYPRASFVGWDSKPDLLAHVTASSRLVACEDVLAAPVDVLLLCGPSGMLTPEVVGRMHEQVRLIGGSANVQCGDPKVDQMLWDRRIVRLPEELANGAGARIVGREAACTLSYMEDVIACRGSYSHAARLAFAAARFSRTSDRGFRTITGATLKHIGDRSAALFAEAAGAGQPMAPYVMSQVRRDILQLSPAVDSTKTEF